MIQDLIRTLDSLDQDIEEQLQNGKQVIRDYCEGLRYEVVFMHESAVEHLNKVSDDMLKEIDAYEQALIDTYEENRKRLDQASQFGEQVQRWTKLRGQYRELIEQAEQYLAAEPKSQDESFIHSQKLKELVEQAKTCYEQSKQAIFQNNFKYFIPNDDFVNHHDQLGFFEHLSHKNAVKRKIDQSFSRLFGL